VDKYHLRLYITGHSFSSRLAVENLERICAKELQGRVQLQIIDVLENPDLSSNDHIIATPTLVKIKPAPVRRMIGELSDKQKVLQNLDIHPMEFMSNKAVHANDHHT
jgi:circadian clock protein KaiB